MAKNYLLNDKATSNILSGINQLADVVKLTLGPKGRNVALDRKYTTPLITNDGVTIAREFELGNQFQNMGVKLIKEVCQRTNDLAGDGTTTAIVLAQKMLNEGMKQCSNGVSPLLINKGMRLATEFCIKTIDQKSNKLSTIKEIQNVATISSQDEEVGRLIAKAHEKLGKTCRLTLQDSNSAKTEVVIQEGTTFDSGFASPYLCNNKEKSKVEYDDCLLLITDKKLNSFNELLPVFEKIVSASKPLIIVCDDVEDEVLSSIIINKVRGAFSVCVVKAPFYGDKKLAFLEDLACLTGTRVFSQNCDDNLQQAQIEDLGKLKQVKITKDQTIVVAKNTDKTRLNTRLDVIDEQIANCTIDFDREQLLQRKANLTGGIATILIGANTDVEQKEKKLRIEDAISATTSALEDGIIAGGGVALLRIEKPLKKYVSTLNPGLKPGAEIILKSLSAPLRQILTNACVSVDVVINKIVKNKNQNYGYDASKDKFVDMIASGIIDPAKVTKSALINATSVVTTLLTTSGLISDEEDKHSFSQNS